MCDELLGFVFGLIEEFEVVVGESGFAKLGVVGGAGLSAAVEEGVAAVDVGVEAVELADAVAEVGFVFFAGAAAVFIRSSFTHEGAEDAVLHVEERHVLMEGEL